MPDEMVASGLYLFFNEIDQLVRYLIERIPSLIICEARCFEVSGPEPHTQNHHGGSSATLSMQEDNGLFLSRGN